MDTQPGVGAVTGDKQDKEQDKEGKPVAKPGQAEPLKTDTPVPALTEPMDPKPEAGAVPVDKQAKEGEPIAEPGQAESPEKGTSIPASSEPGASSQKKEPPESTTSAKKEDKPAAAPDTAAPKTADKAPEQPKEKELEKNTSIPGYIPKFDDAFRLLGAQAKPLTDEEREKIKKDKEGEIAKIKDSKEEGKTPPVLEEEIAKAEKTLSLRKQCAAIATNVSKALDSILTDGKGDLKPDGVKKYNEARALLEAPLPPSATGFDFTSKEREKDLSPAALEKINKQNDRIVEDTLQAMLGSQPGESIPKTLERLGIAPEKENDLREYVRMRITLKMRSQLDLEELGKEQAFSTYVEDLKKREQLAKAVAENGRSDDLHDILINHERDSKTLEKLQQAEAKMVPHPDSPRVRLNFNKDGSLLVTMNFGGKPKATKEEAELMIKATLDSLDHKSEITWHNIPPKYRSLAEAETLKRGKTCKFEHVETTYNKGALAKKVLRTILTPLNPLFSLIKTADVKGTNREIKASILSKTMPKPPQQPGHTGYWTEWVENLRTQPDMKQAWAKQGEKRLEKLVQQVVGEDDKVLMGFWSDISTTSDRKIEELKHKLIERVEERKSLEKQEKELTTKEKECEEKQKGLEAKINDLEEQKSSLEEQKLGLETQQKDPGTTKEGHEAITKKLKEVKEAIDALDKKLKDDTKNIDLKKDLAQATKELDAAKKAHEEAKDKLSQFDKETAAIKARLKAAEENKKTILPQVAAHFTASQVTKLLAAYDKKISELETQQKELKDKKPLMPADQAKLGLIEKQLQSEKEARTNFYATRIQGLADKINALKTPSGKKYEALQKELAKDLFVNSQLSIDEIAQLRAKVGLLGKSKDDLHLEKIKLLSEQYDSLAKKDKERPEAKKLSAQRDKAIQDFISFQEQKGYATPEAVAKKAKDAGLSEGMQKAIKDKQDELIKKKEEAEDAAPAPQGPH